MPSPRQGLWWLLAAVAVVTASVLSWRHLDDRSAPHADRATTSQPQLAGWFDRRPGTAAIEASTPAASAASEVKPFNPLDSTAMPAFRVSAQSHLLIDAETRADLERLVALFANDNGLQRLDTLSADLPVSARHELRDLYQRYMQYDQAMHQAITPGQSTLDEAARQLQTLHELRQQYFGQDAEAMFGAEEAMAAQMLELIRKQTDPKASLEERAAKAQELWQREHPGSP